MIDVFIFEVSETLYAIPKYDVIRVEDINEFEITSLPREKGDMFKVLQYMNKPLYLVNTSLLLKRNYAKDNFFIVLSFSKYFVGLGLRMIPDIFSVDEPEKRDGRKYVFIEGMEIQFLTKNDIMDTLKKLLDF